MKTRYRCPVCNWITPADVAVNELPVNHICSGVNRREVMEPCDRKPVRYEKAERLILEYCQSGPCPHYVERMCQLDRGCKSCGTPDKWRRQLENGRACPLGLWDDVEPLTEQSEQLGGARWDNTTILITAFKRPESLARLEKSIQRYLPQAKYTVLDTDGNISKGRNQLVAECETEYCMIWEDDFEITQHSNLGALFYVLNQDADVGMVGGNLFIRGRTEWTCGDLRLFRDRLELHKPPADPWRWCPQSVRYRYCDMIANFFLARTEVLREHPWDESLEIMEHMTYFWKFREAARWRVAWTDCAWAIHHRDHNDPEYRKWRVHRINHFRQLAFKNGYPFHSNRHILPGARHNRPVPLWDVVDADEGRPNIVVLAAGYQGTRLLMAILQQLGWNLGEVKSDVMEHLGVQRINKQLLRRQDICECGGCGTPGVNGELKCAVCNQLFHRNSEGEPRWTPMEVLRSLEPPWAIKDPRLVLTIEQPEWREALTPHEPVLLLFERSFERTRRSWQQRKVAGGMYGCSLTELLVRARLIYEQWPWRKVAVQYEQLIEAGRAIDFERA
jgi:hypothetical protein